MAYLEMFRTFLLDDILAYSHASN